MALQNRMARELKLLEDPPEGVCAWPVGNSITQLKAQLQGPPGTVYEAGLFQLKLVAPDRYPFEPPKLQFETPVYHPNIDSNGRICLDILNMPPKGAWRPSLTLCTVLAGARQLLAEPNPNDPLMADVTNEYLNNRSLFDMKARALVAKYACAAKGPAADGANCSTAAAAVAGHSPTHQPADVDVSAAGPSEPQRQDAASAIPAATAAASTGNSLDAAQTGDGGPGAQQRGHEPLDESVTMLRKQEAEQQAEPGAVKRSRLA